MDLAGTLLKVAVTWLVVDWISGFVHWCEDSYGSPSTPFIGRRITKPNLRHHFNPRSFVHNSWFASSELLLGACGAALLVAWGLGRLSPMVVVAAVLGINANQVHKWSPVRRWRTAPSSPPCNGCGCSSRRDTISSTTWAGRTRTTAC